MRYLSASPLTIGIINFFITVGFFTGLVYFNFNIWSLVTILIFYFIYSGIGMSMMLHRYWTHNSFEFANNKIKWIFTYIALLTGRGSVIGWVHVHREHHAYSDTSKDPHIKNMSPLKLLFPFLTDHGTKINKFLIRDLLNDTQLRINQYYLPIVLVPVTVLIVINPYIAFLCWFAPTFVTNMLWNIFIQFGHSKKIGYQNYITDDDSKNSFLFGILMLGEGWHNNHHKNPKSYSNTTKWWEIDIVGLIIKVIKK